MAEPEVVIFDIGGVLLTNGWDHLSRELAAKTFDLDPGFEARHKSLAYDLDTARITLDRYLDQVIFDRPRPFARADFLAFMREQSQPYHETLALLDEVTHTGRYLVVALNNESRELNQYRIREFELHRRFDTFLSSCYLGLAKPDDAIYRRALEILHRPADVCVFVDDRPENVAPAHQLGLRAIRHEAAATTRAALRAAGVTL